MAASGQLPCTPQRFHIGTFRPPEDEQSDREDEESITDVIDGRLATARSNVSSTVEHYCIASFIGSTGSSPDSSGQHDCACSSRDSYMPADTGLVAGGSEGGTCVGSEGGSGLHDEAFHPPSAVAARITGRSGKFYVIEVSGKPGAPPAGKLHRRYSEFAVLEHLVRHKFAGLPKLPRKSVFSKRFNPGFLPERERGLEAFLRAVVAADPVLEDSSVRAFLDPMEQQFCLKGQAASGLTSRRSSCSSGRSSHAQSSRT